MLDKELSVAMDLARTAGALILDYYTNGFEAEEKIGLDEFVEPVTIADKMASRLIVDGLSATFPNDGILSEEEPDSEHRLGCKRVWMIDPLDGTAGFIKRDGDFAVQIGLVESGKPILGVVYLPIGSTMFHATVNGGAFAGSGDFAARRLEVSAVTEMGMIRMAASRNHYSPKMKRVVDEFGIQSEVRRGSVGLKVGLIAESTADLYLHLSPHTKQWDTCAPQVILEEAGGRLTDMFGSAIEYNTPDIRNHNGILASNGVIHEASVSRLRLLLNEFGRRPHRLTNPVR